MLTKLTMGEKLKDLRIKHGFKNTEDLAVVVNIPRSTLNDYEDDEKNQDVGYQNLVTLAKFYGVSMDWLLGLSDTNKHLNTSYCDLGLSDNVLDILKAKKFNTRLLSEMIEDPNFVDLLADMEIYIDGMASIRINALNADLKATRAVLKKKYNPDDSDMGMRTLLAGQIQEDRYFHGIIHDDIDKITHNIRELHRGNKKDTTVAKTDIDVCKMVITAVEEYETTKDSRFEKALQFISRFTGMPPDSLNEDEKSLFKKIGKSVNKFWKKK